LSPILVNIGFGNVVAAAKVVAIVTPGSAPMKRLREEAKKAGRLVDATEGRRTRSIIVTDSNHIILSAIQAETITQRFFEEKEESAGEEEYRHPVHRLCSLRDREDNPVHHNTISHPKSAFFGLLHNTKTETRRSE
jgi:hypothetical protein